MRDEVSFALVSIYTKSARSLVKLRSGCLQINTRKLPGLNWGTDNKENNLLHAVFSFNSYNQPGYDDEMPCNIEATQSQAATATHAYHVIQACNHIKDFKSELSEETSTNIARIGTARLLRQQEKQTSSHLCRTLVLGNSHISV